jgi:hypothetical protein
MACMFLSIVTINFHQPHINFGDTNAKNARLNVIFNCSSSNQKQAILIVIVILIIDASTDYFVEFDYLVFDAVCS